MPKVTEICFLFGEKKGVECIEKYVLISNVMISKGNFIFAFYFSVELYLC